MTRLTIATINVQKRKNVSHVMYIGITSLVYEEGNKKDFFDFLKALMRKQPPPFYDVPLVIE